MLELGVMTLGTHQAHSWLIRSSAQGDTGVSCICRGSVPCVEAMLCHHPEESCLQFLHSHFPSGWKLDLCRLMCFMYKTTSVFLPKVVHQLSQPVKWWATGNWFIGWWWQVSALPLCSDLKFGLGCWITHPGLHQMEIWSLCAWDRERNACSRSMGWHLGGTQLLGWDGFCWAVYPFAADSNSYTFPNREQFCGCSNNLALITFLSKDQERALLGILWFPSGNCFFEDSCDSFWDRLLIPWGLVYLRAEQIPKWEEGNDSKLPLKEWRCVGRKRVRTTKLWSKCTDKVCKHSVFSALKSWATFYISDSFL